MQAFQSKIFGSAEEINHISSLMSGGLSEEEEDKNFQKTVIQSAMDVLNEPKEDN